MGGDLHDASADDHTSLHSTPSAVASGFLSSMSVAKQCVALYPYAATAEDELTIRENEQLTLVEDEYEGWVRARNASGQEGLVPATYVQITAAAAPSHGQHEHVAAAGSRPAVATATALFANEVCVRFSIQSVDYWLSCPVFRHLEAQAASALSHLIMGFGSCGNRAAVALPALCSCGWLPTPGHRRTICWRLRRATLSRFSSTTRRLATATGWAAATARYWHATTYLLFLSGLCTAPTPMVRPQRRRPQCW